MYVRVNADSVSVACRGPQLAGRLWLACLGVLFYECRFAVSPLCRSRVVLPLSMVSRRGKSRRCGDCSFVARVPKSSGVAALGRNASPLPGSKSVVAGSCPASFALASLGVHATASADARTVLRRFFWETRNSKWLCRVKESALVTLNEHACSAFDASHAGNLAVFGACERK